MNKKWLLIGFLGIRISDIRGIKKDQFPKEQKLMFPPHCVSAEIPAAADMLQAQWVEGMGGNPAEETVDGRKQKQR